MEKRARTIWHAQYESAPHAAVFLPEVRLTIMAQKFSLSNAAAGSKRLNDDQKSPVKKIPKVSEMKMDAPRPQTQRAVSNAPVNICIYKISDLAGDQWAAFKDTPTKLWQVQLEHDARPSITVNILASFNDFLKENAKVGVFLEGFTLPDNGGEGEGGLTGGY